VTYGVGWENKNFDDMGTLSRHLNEIDLNRNYACQTMGALSTVLHYIKCTLRNLLPAENAELEI